MMNELKLFCNYNSVNFTFENVKNNQHLLFQKSKLRNFKIKTKRTLKRNKLT